MRRYAEDSWEIDLAKGWTAAPEEECVAITKSNDSGALQISSYHKPEGAISREELLESTDCDAEAQRHLKENVWGDFAGFHLAYSEDDAYWRMWWLASGRTLLFLTYNCDLARKDDEKKDIDQMVGSLRAKGRTKRGRHRYCDGSSPAGKNGDAALLAPKELLSLSFRPGRSRRPPDSE